MKELRMGRERKEWIEDSRKGREKKKERKGSLGLNLNGFLGKGKEKGMEMKGRSGKGRSWDESRDRKGTGRMLMDWKKKGRGEVVGWECKEQRNGTEWNENGTVKVIAKK